MRTVRVYRLIDPNTFAIRYIGQTVQKLSYRLSGHLSTKRRSHTSSWIESLRKQELKPLIELICEVQTMAEADELEKILIRYYRSIGCNLTNHDEGGQANRMTSDSTRQKISEATRGARHPQYGKAHTAEARAKMRLAKLGTKLSEETRQRMSLANKGRHVSEKTRARMRSGHSPASHSSQQRLAQSISHTGKPWSNARRQAFDPVKHAEAHSKTWRVTSPSGEAQVVKNLAAFCRARGLSLPKMSSVAAGRQIQHKGWSCSLTERCDNAEL